MNKHCLAVKGAALSLILAVSVAFGAVILEEDFTNQALFNFNWLGNSQDNAMTATVGNNSVVINNTGDNMGSYHHTLNTKPSTFTLSVVLKSLSSPGEAGIMFCKQSANDFNGYFLTIKDNTVYLHEMTQTGNSIGYNSIFGQTSHHINQTDNKLTVSKTGSNIHISVNDMAVGSVTNSRFNSGDVALVVFSKVTAAFSGLTMTDQFTAGNETTSFTDDFNGNNLKFWKFLKSGTGGDPVISETGGELQMTTGAAMTSWMYTDMNLKDEFIARVEVRHVSGAVDQPYGIFLIGDVPPGGSTYPMVSFAISGGRYYATFSGPYTLKPNTAINGEAGAQLGRSDTLEVIKKADSEVYEFWVNGTLISQEQAVADFNITGVGIFSYPGIGLAFDNFHAKQTGKSSVTWGSSSKTARRPGAIVKNKNALVYDLKGRKRGAMTPTAAGQTKIRAAGVYVNEYGKEVQIRKRK